MVITMTLFAKYYTKNKTNKILAISMITIVISFVSVLISLNKATIILYNFVYYIFIQLMDTITAIRLYNYSNKTPFDKELNTEYFIFRELFLNFGRVVGYVILLGVGVLHNIQYLKVLFIFTTIALVLIILISKKLTKNEDD